MILEAASAQQAPPAIPGGPWLGLQSYEEGHCHLFFGRESDSDELFRLVKRDVLTVLYGRSGLGKTSLLNAGLFPRLRQHSHLPIPIRLGVGGRGAPAPLLLVKEAITAEIARRGMDVPAPRDTETLWEYFHATSFCRHENKAQTLTPVLVFDQFEEAIGRDAADPRREALYEELSDVIENSIPTAVRARVEGSGEGLPFRYDSPKIRVIFSLREDYLGELQELKPLIPSLMRSVYRLKPMSGTQATEAVIEPARQAGLAIPDDVAGRIVRISAGETEGGCTRGQRPMTPLEKLEVEPALLSLFCDELNKTRADRGLSSITMELARGERGGILSRFYEDRTEDLPPKVKRFIEEELLTKEGHRKFAAEEDLEDAIKVEVNKLIDRRLLRRETPAGRPSYLELIHDVLAEPIVKSRNERRQQEAVAHERHRQEEARLEEVARLELERQRYRARVLGLAAAICGVLLVIAVGFMVVYWQARDELFAESLAARAEYLVTDPDGWATSALLATESVKRRFTPVTTAAWAAAIDRSPRNEVLDHLLVTAVAANPDGTRMATASGDEVLRLWDAGSGRQLVQRKDENWRGFVAAMTFAHDGTRLVVARFAGPTSEHHVRLQTWDAELGRRLTERELPTDVIRVAFSLDGRRAAILDSSDLVRLWDVDSGKEVGTPWRYPESVTSETPMALSADGRLAGSSDGTVRVWNVESGHQLIQLDADESRRDVTAVTFSTDGRRLATVERGERFMLRIWDAERGTPLTERELPSPVTTMAFSPDGMWLAAAHRPGGAKVWPLKRATELSTLASEAPVTSMALTPDATHVVAVVRQSVRQWDVKSGAEIPALTQGRDGPARPLSVETFVTAVARSRDGRLVATTTDKNVAVRDVATTKRVVLEHPAPVTDVAFSWDDKRLTSTSTDGNARVWDLASGTVRMSLPHPGTVNGAAFSRDGRRLVTGGADRAARVWDLEGGGLLVALEHSQPVGAVAFSADGRRLASTSPDGNVRVWDWEHHRETVRLRHPKPIRSLAFTATGDDLVTVDVDYVIREWPLTADRMVRKTCTTLLRNLTRADWRLYLRDETYSPTCSDLPED